ncbi:L-lactate permease [Microbacterium terricola]|uniref:L-lactate permease n=1 Tax=Microbacterium terricola TaxID=344163 RepID=A0ABM8DXA2_9MICO|nr:L-lactate permease [Microbacterium terricola]UYK38996.1 L-lactate permease [Microbacterium terricola]BDV30298.1 L-lactate permease [Microbacterium terricola]
MWDQSIDPVGRLWLSALIAIIPILVFLLCLVVFKMRGITAGVIAVILQIVVAIWPFGMPVPSVAGAGLLGLLTAIWPIAYIIVMAVWLYRLTVASGRFDVIRTSISGISPDQRVQVLLISFCFGGFLEGAAGFGVPIAICAALLVQLGFGAVKAAMLCLVANVAAGAYGAIGIPVIVGARVGEVDVMALSFQMVLVLQLLSLVTPFLLVLILDGVKGVRETFPMILGVTVAYNGAQALILTTLGPELADIVPGLFGMAVVFMISRVWKPSRVYREDGGVAPARVQQDFSDVVVAWSPFYILTGVIFVWSIPWFKNLFVPGGPLDALVFSVPIPGITGVVIPAGADAATTTTWDWTPINATGTAILIAVLIMFFTTPQLSARQLWSELGATVAQLWQAIVLIALILMVANIANYSGGSASIGNALAAVGPIFPLFAPIIGWFGVFITGSVVNNNTLFAHLQSITAQQIGVDPTLLVAANTAGGTVAKLVSPQSIAIAAGAVGLVGRESEILRASIKYSLAMLAFICVWVYLLSLARLSL